MNKHQGDDLAVMVLATTNRLGISMRAMRHAWKKHLCEPPDAATREAMLYLHLSIRKQEGDNGTVGTDDHDEETKQDSRGCQYLADDLDLHAVTAATEGYSGADIRLLCREAAMMPMRRLLEGKVLRRSQLRRSGELEKPGKITQSDFESALARTKPSVAQSAEALARFKKWEENFGSK